MFVIPVRNERSRCGQKHESQIRKEKRGGLVRNTRMRKRCDMKKGKGVGGCGSGAGAEEVRARP